MNFQSFRWDKYSWKPSTYVIASGSSISTSAASAGIPLILVASASTLSTSTLSAIQKMSIEAHGGSFNFAWDAINWNGFGWYVDPFSRASANPVLRDTESLWGASISSATAIITQQIKGVASASSGSRATSSAVLTFYPTASASTVSLMLASIVQTIQAEAHGGSFNFAWDAFNWDEFGWYVDPFSRAYANPVLRDSESLWGAAFSSATAIITHQKGIISSGSGTSNSSLDPVMTLSLQGIAGGVSTVYLLSNQINLQMLIDHVWKSASDVRILINGQWRTVTEVQININGWKTI